jgi:hypothetical protein
MMTKVINRHHQGRDSGDPNTIPKSTQSTSTSNLVDPLSPSCTRTGGYIYHRRSGTKPCEESTDVRRWPTR